VPEYYATEGVRRFRDGSVEVTLRVGDPRWLERLVLRLAPHASIVRPAEFADSFTATARSALALYE
jgi:proteasome accessory factor C